MASHLFSMLARVGLDIACTWRDWCWTHRAGSVFDALRDAVAVMIEDVELLALRSEERSMLGRVGSCQTGLERKGWKNQ